jgi:hypothetical protein
MFSSGRRCSVRVFLFRFSRRRMFPGKRGRMSVGMGWLWAWDWPTPGGAWTGLPPYWLLTRAKNLYDQKKPRGWKFRPCPHKSRLFGNRWRVQIAREAQAIFFRRRHQARRPPPAKIRPGSPAPAMGPGTARNPRISPLVRTRYPPRCGQDLSGEQNSYFDRY